MPELPETFTVELGGRIGNLPLSVEEFHPYEPSAYVTDPGWSAFEGDDEYFISLSGQVYTQPSNTYVGTAPLLVRAQEEIERAMTSAYHSELDNERRTSIVEDDEIG